MRILPMINNQTNQKTPTPAFEAKLKNDTLKIIARSLSGVLPDKETDKFLTEVAKREKQIAAIKFKNNEEVLISSPGLGGKSEDESKNIIVYAESEKSPGTGVGNAWLYVKFFKEGNLIGSSKTLAKRFIKAIKEATDDIANSREYLSKKAEEIQNKINNPQPKKVEMSS